MANGQKSGLYKRTLRGLNFELRLDVDGNQPQNQVSVAITNQFDAHWIADLQLRGFDTWEGPIWFRHEDAQALRIGGRLPNTLRVRWRERFGLQHVTLVFMFHTRQLGGLSFMKDSEAFREVEFELDQEIGVDFPTSYDLGSHNDRPADLAGVLTLEDAYAAAGVSVRRTGQGNLISSANSGFNNAWNESELHDAMQTHWSRTDGTPWSMWVMAADHYENEPGFVTFGIMFDSIGSFHRNGTAVFNQSIEDFYPANTPQRNETIARHKFRTLVHEIGHAFNLAHSWQKQHPAGTPWSSRLTDEPDALSFMNYPRNVTGGALAYWDNFRFQFSEQELLFLRHAPDTFVAMGGESWFVNHGETIDLFGNAELDQLDDFETLDRDSPLQLEVRFPNRRPVFKYMEPVVAEVRLTNVGPEPLALPLEVLDPQNLVIHLTRNGAETTRLRPYARHCRVAKHDMELAQGARNYGSVYLSSSANGWNVTDPGRYDVAVELRAPAVDGSPTSAVLASAGATFYVRQPDREAERAAQDVFSDEVGRVLALGGSKVLTDAVNIVRENVSRLGVLATAALALPSTREFKRIDTIHETRIESDAADEQEIVSLAETLIKAGPNAPIELGHVGFSRLTDLLATRSAAVKRVDVARNLHENLLGVMENRGVQLPTAVIDKVRQSIANLSGKG